MEIFYEREEITTFLGSDSAKLSFIQEYNLNVVFKKNDRTIFYCSGVFQLEDGPTILILPWFLKKSEELFDLENSYCEKYEFFDFIKQIKFLKSSTIDLNPSDKGFGLEIILYSFFEKTKYFLDRVMSGNYFVEIEEGLKSIKGKWHFNKDLRTTGRPIKFNCTFGDVNKNIFQLSLLKGFLLGVSKELKTLKTKEKVSELLSKLVGVDSIFPHKREIDFCESLRSNIASDKEWISIFEFIRNYILSLGEKVLKSGFAYTFPMDKIFEEILSTCFKKFQNYQVSYQKRSDLLGGGVWTNDQNSQEIPIEIISRSTSIPDIILESSSHYIIVECKYKPIKNPLYSGNSSENSISFNRDDRNQMLSFILSIPNELNISKKRLSFNVVFPITGDKNFEKFKLRFNNSKMMLQAGKKILMYQNKKIDGNGLEIQFVGINLRECFSRIAKDDFLSYIKEFEDCIVCK